MRIADYHDSFLTTKPAYIPMVIPSDYPESNLPNGDIYMAPLVDKCPNCSCHLWGSFRHKKRVVKNVMCWNINCMWKPSDEKTEAS